MDAFDVYFLGEMLPDADPAEVRQGVAKLFNVADDAIERLFSGNPLRVKKGVDAETASRYRAAFREAGALIQIVPEGSPPPAVAPSSAATASSSSHAETHTPSTPERQQATSTVTLAEPGATIDETPPSPPANIDTGSLEALPPNSGSLEDCHIEKPPHPIPDISHLRLVDD